MACMLFIILPKTCHAELAVEERRALIVTTILQRFEPMTAGWRAAAGGEGCVIVSLTLIN